MKFWNKIVVVFFPNEKTLQLELKRNKQQVIFFYKDKVFHFFQLGRTEFEMTVEEHNELMLLIKGEI